MKVEFKKDSDEVKLMAIYLSQLTREGVEYRIDNRADRYDVTITGF